MKSVRDFGAMFTFILVTIMIFTGCGDDSSQTSSESTLESTISGVATKGPIVDGSVAAYSIDSSGQKVTPALATGFTDGDGNYSLPIDYSGPVLVEVTSGTYEDEATGESVEIETTLRAAMASVSGDVSIAVTPLTEIAVRTAEAGGGLSADKIEDANELLSQMLGSNGDILSTMPADPRSDTAFANATAEEQNYSLLLSSISQMAADGGQDVADILDTIEDDLQDLKLDQAGTQLTTALNNFLNNPKNKTGAQDADELTGRLDTIRQDGFTPTGDLAEAKVLLAEFLNDPQDSNYNTFVNYLDTFTPQTQEAYLFKAVASLMHIYQSEAAEFIVDSMNLSTNFETFDVEQFTDALLASATIGDDIIALFAEITDKLDDTYNYLEAAEGADTLISMTGFDMVYMDDVDVKMLKFMTKALQSVFIFAQAIDLGVDDWEVGSGDNIWDVRDILSSGLELSEAQADEFWANNSNLLGYANDTKLADFKTAVAQMASDLDEVVTALDAMGSDGRETRRRNAFNIDSDHSFYMLKTNNDIAMPSLISAMADASTDIVVPRLERVGDEVVKNADDGYSYAQSEYEIYLESQTPASGLITLYDLISGYQSLRDWIDEAESTTDYEPYLKGSPELYQEDIYDIDWDWPLESVDMPAAEITIDGDAADWETVPVFKTVDDFNIKIATGTDQTYYVNIAHQPMSSNDEFGYDMEIGMYSLTGELEEAAADYYSAGFYLAQSDGGDINFDGSEYSQDQYGSVAAGNIEPIYLNDSLAGMEVMFSQLDILTATDSMNWLYLDWTIDNVDGFSSEEIKLYP